MLGGSDLDKNSKHGILSYICEMGKSQAKQLSFTGMGGIEEKKKIDKER